MATEPEHAIESELSKTPPASGGLPASPCAACQGTGRNEHNDPCNECDGIGRVIPETEPPDFSMAG